MQHEATHARLPLDARTWHVTRDGDPSVVALYARHYSARRYGDGRPRRLVLGPGERVVLITPAGDAVLVWRRFRSRDPLARGVNCAIFRNENPETLASRLLRAGEVHARRRWPDEDTLYTYVNAARIRSTNPGYCFLMVGWRRVRRTKGGLVVFEKTMGVTEAACRTGD